MAHTASRLELDPTSSLDASRSSGATAHEAAASATQAFTGRMVLATGLAIAGGVSLASAATDASSPLFTIGLLCLAGSGAVQHAARRRLRALLVRCAVAGGMSEARARERADADLAHLTR